MFQVDLETHCEQGKRFVNTTGSIDIHRSLSSDSAVPSAVDVREVRDVTSPGIATTSQKLGVLDECKWWLLQEDWSDFIQESKFYDVRDPI